MRELEEEFLAKLDKHKGVIFKISKMYMDNFEDQNDLYQEIIYQSWKSYPDFRGESDFSTWLYRTALNTAIIFLKSQKKRSIFLGGKIDDFSAVHEPYSGQKDRDLEAMYEAIQQLNAVEKILIFYYLENYSGKEIAAEMGISEANVRVKLNRLKTKLRQTITQSKKD